VTAIPDLRLHFDDSGLIERRRDGAHGSLAAKTRAITEPETTFRSIIAVHRSRNPNPHQIRDLDIRQRERNLPVPIGPERKCSGDRHCGIPPFQNSAVASSPFRQ
jgi:hypothetical protein